MTTRAIVLAAGQGTRMRSALPKVLHPVAGRPLLSWVVEAVLTAGIDDVTVVVGVGADEVRAVLPEGVATVVQERQEGTGHATLVALEERGEPSGTVVVLPGDSPLIRPDTIAALVARRETERAAAAMLTTVLADPTGYGRILRSEEGDVAGIIEERDADAGQRAITEVGVSMYAFDGEALAGALAKVGTDNAQAEMYLTDVVGILAGEGDRVVAVPARSLETAGVNSHDQLAAAGAELRRRINENWMRQGVWMLDPSRVYVDAGVTLEAGVRLYPGVHLEGNTTIAAGAQVGPDTFVRDSSIGPEAVVWYATVRGAEVGAGAQVGPYASLRPGTVLAEGAKAGTFVETKATRIGPRSKVPHLSYLGDATIGEDSNIGAGTITCNYDGFDKHPTRIGDRVRVGSDTMLVAPVELGDDSWTAAGSAITSDVEPGALGVARSHQRNVADYAARRRRRHADGEEDGEGGPTQS